MVKAFETMTVGGDYQRELDTLVLRVVNAYTKRNTVQRVSLVTAINEAIEAN